MSRIIPLIVLLLTVAAAGSAVGDVISVTLRTVDPVTQLPIDTIEIGDTFTLQAIVEDVRTPPRDLAGVFSAVFDVTFDESLAAPAGPLVFADFFNFLQNATILPGYLQNVSAYTTYVDYPGQVEQLFFSMTFQANHLGHVEFTPAFADYPLGEFLVYFKDDPELPLPLEDVTLSGTSITIVPEPSGGVLFATAVLGLLGYSYRRRY